MPFHRCKVMKKNGVKASYVRDFAIKNENVRYNIYAMDR